MSPVAIEPVAVPAAGGEAMGRRRFIQELFTRIAPRYDWFNRLASCGLDQRWRRLAIARSGLRPGMRVLDVCTGTGDLALLCARAQRADARITGVDLNAEMLRLARRKAARGGAAGITWLRADAMALPFPAGTFDRVYIGFSTRNLTDLGSGLQELLRVVRRNGQLVILETGRPASRLVRLGYHAFLATAARTIGFLLTGRCWPFGYLARSVRQFATPEQMLARLRGLGAEARYVPLSAGLASLFLATKGEEG